MLPLNVADYERLAAERLDEGAFGYFAGGANGELTLRENIDAYTRWQLRPRVLTGVAEATTATTALGHDLALPLIVAPVAYQRIAHSDAEAGMARAAAAAGTVMCLSTFTTTPPEDVAAAGGARWFQLYAFRDPGQTRDVVARVRAAGFSVLILTVDTPVGSRRERDLRTAFSIPPEVTIEYLGRGGLTPQDAFGLTANALRWEDVAELAELSGLPIVLKGVTTAEDARLAAEAGVAAVVVSNHGGRQLDGVAASIDSLPEVVEAVEGRIEVFVDGGIRRGTDVLKALALGARAVLAGRAPLWGLAVDGEAGATHVLELLREEIRLALVLLGCDSPAAVERAHVQRAR